MTVTVTKKYKGQIANSTASLNIGTGNPINLHRLIAFLANSSMNIQRFPAIKLRLEHPKISALLFRFGKMSIVGGRHPEEVKLAAHSKKKGLIIEFRKMVSSLGIKTNFSDFSFQNFVFSGSVDHDLDLKSLQKNPQHLLGERKFGFIINHALYGLLLHLSL